MIFIVSNRIRIMISKVARVVRIGVLVPDVIPHKPALVWHARM
jgi:hypothetical protein